MRFGLLFLLLGCMATAAHAEQFTGKVIAVLDGDTVMVKRSSGRPIKVRLAEIDAPEKAQDFGETSRRSLSDMVLGKQVKVDSQAVDQYGRMVAHLSVDGLDVNAEQIHRGMAWEYSNFHSNRALVALQHEAMQAPRGLWAQGNPASPSEWRKQHPGIFSTQPNVTTPAVTVPVKKSSQTPGCNKPKHCAEMSSCEEAKHFFALCDAKALDGDGDGVPCENLCIEKK